MDEFATTHLVYELLLKMLNIHDLPDKCNWGTTWESIRLPEGYEKPPKEAFEAKLQELIDAQPLKKLRQERNRRLAEVDWVFSTDYQIDDDDRTNNGSRTAKPYATFLQRRKIRRIPFGRNNR